MEIPNWDAGMKSLWLNVTMWVAPEAIANSKIMSSLGSGSSGR